MLDSCSSDLVLRDLCFQRFSRDSLCRVLASPHLEICVLPKDLGGPQKDSNMSLQMDNIDRSTHPVDVVEQLAAQKHWSFERSAPDEISIGVSGRWSEYQVAFTWIGDMEALHVSTAFEFKVPDHKRDALRDLISMINEQLWVGHFEYWQRDQVIMFRHALLLAGGSEPNGQQCEALLSIASDACERYFEAFQYVVWAGKTPREALDFAMFETAGSA